MLGDRVLELDEPAFETPDEVPNLSRPVRTLFEWLGFRYLRLRTVGETEPVAVAPRIEGTPIELEAVPA